MTKESLSEVRSQVSIEEWQLRVDLAACYRLIALHRWEDLVFTHISARVPSSNHEHHFLINPYGMLFDEITASSLVKVDEHCTKITDSSYPVNPAGFLIHSAVHAAREDVQCVLHTHTRAGIAVSAQKAGVLPISQQATLVLASLAYHDFGNANYLMLRNHGLLTVGTAIADAFSKMYMFESACQIQVSAQAGGGELTLVSPDIIESVAQAVKIQAVGRSSSGQLVWPSLIRKLDRLDPSYKQ